MRSPRRLRVITLGCVVLGAPLAAQVQTEVPPPVPGARPVSVERVKIHGAALEGNLEGDAVDRDAIVFLPPSYAKDKVRRYPVVYALHGYSIGAEQWSGEIHVAQTIEGAIAQGAGGRRCPDCDAMTTPAPPRARSQPSVPGSSARFHHVLAENRQETDKSAPIYYPARLLLELVELMGIEPNDLVNAILLGSGLSLVPRPQSWDAAPQREGPQPSTGYPRVTHIPTHRARAASKT